MRRRMEQSDGRKKPGGRVLAKVMEPERGVLERWQLEERGMWGMLQDRLRWEASGLYSTERPPQSWGAWAWETTKGCQHHTICLWVSLLEVLQGADYVFVCSSFNSICTQLLASQSLSVNVSFITEIHDNSSVLRVILSPMHSIFFFFLFFFF